MKTVAEPSSALSTMTVASTMYMLSRGQLKSLINELFDNTFLNSWMHLWDMPVDAVTSVYMYPIDYSTIFPSATAVSVNLAGVTLQTTAQVIDPTTTLITVGGYTFTPYFNNFMDFSPYTQIEIYLPYVGWEKLDPEMVMGHTIAIRYSIDYTTGGCTAYVLRDTGADQTLIMQRDGKIGIQIPLAGRNASEIARNLLISGVQAAGGIAAGVVAGGAVGAVAGAMISGGSSLINAAQPKVRGSGAVGYSAGIFTPQNCVLKFTRPIPHIPSSYGHYVGYMSGKTKQLSQLSGYTVVSRIHVEHSTAFSGATTDEITEIENLLKSGVIL